MGSRRSPRHESDRIGVHQCDWRRHPSFADDIGRLQVDPDTWSAMKTLLRRTAQGTVRDEEWEYPCASSNGMLGELKMQEEDEVDVISPAGVSREAITVHYRLYFNEPKPCPTDLWAMGAGAKALHASYPSTDQQNDIDVSKGRVMMTTPAGNELQHFPV